MCVCVCVHAHECYTCAPVCIARCVLHERTRALYVQCCGSSLYGFKKSGFVFNRVSKKKFVVF